MLKDGEPCTHPGCLNHVSHPCEGCGRIGGRGYARYQNGVETWTVCHCGLQMLIGTKCSVCGYECLEHNYISPKDGGGVPFEHRQQVRTEEMEALRSVEKNMRGMQDGYKRLANGEFASDVIDECIALLDRHIESRADSL